MAYSKRQASDWNDASFSGFHATAVGELYMNGISIGMDVVARAVGLEIWPLRPVSDISC